MKTAAIAIAACLLLAFAICTIQFISNANETDRAVKNALKTWLEQNPEGGKEVARYAETCHTALLSVIPPVLATPTLHAECTALVSEKSLAVVIQQAVDTIVVPAPLRWL